MMDKPVSAIRRIFSLIAGTTLLAGGGVAVLTTHLELGAVIAGVGLLMAAVTQGILSVLSTALMMGALALAGDHPLLGFAMVGMAVLLYIPAIWREVRGKFGA